MKINSIAWHGIIDGRKYGTLLMFMMASVTLQLNHPQSSFVLTTSVEAFTATTPITRTIIPAWGKIRTVTSRPTVAATTLFSTTTPSSPPPPTTTAGNAASSATSTTTATAARTINDNSNNNNNRFIPFSKYHGLGNDFILIDNRHTTEPILSPDDAVNLCHRNFGIGADGIIFALKSSQQRFDGGTGIMDYDFAMRIYNADGSEPEMCGNGIRCLARFVQDLEQKEQHMEGDDKDNNGAKDLAQASYRIHTLAGPIVPVMNRDGSVTVDMGEPIIAASAVPTTLVANFDSDSVVEQTLTDLNGKEWKVTAVSMGNPHAIIFVDDLDTDVVLHVDGPAIESDRTHFPAKTNVEFVQVLAPNHLRMKVWERGAGPTLACGTGACALTVAAIRSGKIPRPVSSSTHDENDPTVRVTLPGGDLFIEWRESDNKVYMTGPATLTFHGTAVL